MRIGLLAVLLFSVGIAGGACTDALGQSVVPVTVERSVQHTIESAYVDDTFVIQVRLPISYATTEKKYQVLYVLDGDKCFGLAADTAEWLAWAKEAPDLIVVGIGYGPGRDWWEKRSRDFTPTQDVTRLWGEWPQAGGAVKFEEFLYRELFPLIESRYRALADDRAVAGLSFGGLFGTVSLFTRPALFHRYILIGPPLVWDNRRIWQYEADYRAKSSALTATVFTAVGNQEDPTILEPWAEFNRLIESRRYDGLRWITRTYPEESHISVLPGALSGGIRRVYK
ncbi:MAG: alpha/beta hydrolase-fold protein [Nitrospira sp.]|nr:alpha/beta hydrolase-fold protein [Nitrospira sp.]